MKCPVWRAVRQPAAVTGGGSSEQGGRIYITPWIKGLLSETLHHLPYPVLSDPMLQASVCSQHHEPCHGAGSRRHLHDTFRFKDISCGIRCGRGDGGRGLSPAASAFLCQNYFIAPPFSLTCRAMDGQWAPFRPQCWVNIIPPHSTSFP